MLDKYRSKRNFDVTAEPSPEVPAASGERLKFVVQKHSARRLHYDLRLEAEGALKSWAVPKGPSLDPKEKRLSVHVEDHPLSYASFEGVIPKGEYGGGEVIVWDQGTYGVQVDSQPVIWDRTQSEPLVLEGLAAGKLKFWLEGEKLRGAWHIVRSSRSEKDWILIKSHDEFESTHDVTADKRSVITGRTNEDLQKGRPPKTKEMPKGAIEKPAPKTLVPMLLTEVDKPFTNEAWSFELKLDGVRVLAFLNRGRACLLTRNGHDVTSRFPTLVTELEAIVPPDCILDGEIVVFDEAGRPTFQGLMQRFQLQNDADIRAWDQRAHLDFVLFDLIYLGKWDLRACAQRDRRRALEELGIRGRHTHLIDAYPEIGELLFDQALKLGLEGIVGKKLDSAYVDGQRTRSWVKIKTSHTDEFVVGGYIKGQGARSDSFGSLLLGSLEDGKLVYCGSVGGGFSDKELHEFHQRLETMRVDKSPFDEKITLLRGAKPIWVKPELWVEVKFMAWTEDKKLRAPRFLRLREDLSMDNPPKKTRSQAEAIAAPAPEMTSSNIVEELAQAKEELHTEVDGEKLKFTSLSKILWPATDDKRAVTKRDLATYLFQACEPLLRSLRDRPLSLVRYPQGIEGEGFFQKHVEKGVPDFVDRVRLWSSHNGRAVEYLLCNNLPTLLWMAQNSVLEIHPWYSRITPGSDAPGLTEDFATSEETLDESLLNYPDFLVVDLDPNLRSGKEKEGAEPEMNIAAWEMAVKVAKKVRQTLLDLGLTAFLKTSGKTGLHLYVPVVREYDYDTIRALAETLGRHVMKEMPKEVTMEWSVKKRPEKIFFDHNQNVRGKTLVAAYSPRAAAGATVSMPLRWEELDDVYPADFDLFTVPKLLERRPDPWADILTIRQRIV